MVVRGCPLTISRMVEDPLTCTLKPVGNVFLVLLIDFYDVEPLINTFICFFNRIAFGLFYEKVKITLKACRDF
jgi:hypothetical protein